MPYYVFQKRPSMGIKKFAVPVGKIYKFLEQKGILFSPFY